MINEEHNKQIHWKNKLDELDNLPGESFNKEELWNKLHDRLRGNAGKKKVLWYWAAASVLFFVIIIPFLISDTFDPNVVKTNKPTINPNENILKQSAIDKGFLVNNNVSTENEKNKVLKIKAKPKNKIAYVNVIMKQIDITQNSVEDMKTETTSNSLQAIDTFSNIGFKILQKKKLPVVHINELGDPLVAEPAMARNSNRHSFQMQFANQEVFINPSVASDKTGIITLKTISSPN